MSQKVGVFEAYNRAKTGPKIEEKEWDYKIIPQNAKRLKEKYGLKFNKEQIIPTDEDMINRIFKAGLEMLVETGVYCMDTGRVIKYTEEEVLYAIKTAPKKVTIGEGRDAVELAGRKGNAPTPPIIQGGPTGAPVSEDLFVALHEGYAREPLVDTIVDGVLQTIWGYDPQPGSPWEIAAVKSEAIFVRAAQARAGRPGMGL
jgi:methylamine--corrinoid protein Co-methyltransferase